MTLPARPLAALILAALAGPAPAATTLLNVSYDPTRELYAAIDRAFVAHREALGRPPVRVEQSHGGSGAQARAVLDGLGADVVTLALAPDIDRLAEAGLVAPDWASRWPHRAAPYTSTIVFLVRAGNPRAIRDWDDLVREGVEVILPNPKTSGGARWAYLAAWAWASRTGRDPEAFLRELFAHVPVLDTGARGAATTFTRRGLGDVLLSWESEAHLARRAMGEGAFEIVVPSVSIRAEPPVALVDANLDGPAEREAAEAYLEFLYAPEAQAIALAQGYRAWDASAADPADVAALPPLDLVTVDELGGWPALQAAHFARGGLLDRIFEGEP